MSRKSRRSESSHASDRAEYLMTHELDFDRRQRHAGEHDARRVFCVSLLAATAAHAQRLNPQPLPPSPNWARAMPPGPDTRVKITEEYATHVARDAYFWAWPLVNIYNRRLAFQGHARTDVSGGRCSSAAQSGSPCSPTISSPTSARRVPQPGCRLWRGPLALDISPVVIQVPDFGDRFWVYQIVDLRTDSFVQLGKMYGTTPGFYLLVGPNWQGDVPKGITRVFRSSTNTGFVAPRVSRTIRPRTSRRSRACCRIMMYPLAEYDGRMKTKDWTTLPKVPAAPRGDEETQWVFPDKFFDELPAVLADAPPLPGEEARYAQVLAVLDGDQGQSDAEAGDDRRPRRRPTNRLVKPLFEFRNYGQQLPHHWSTISNEAAFGTDYFTRTAVAKSNIFVNSPNETKYFYQDLDASGARLNGANRYTVTFAKDRRRRSTASGR